MEGQGRFQHSHGPCLSTPAASALLTHTQTGSRQLHLGSGISGLENVNKGWKIPSKSIFLCIFLFLQLLHGWRSPSGITQGRAVRPPAFSGEGLVLGRERGAGCLFKCALQCDGGRPAGRAIPPCGRSPPAAIARPVPMVTRLPPALGPPVAEGATRRGGGAAGRAGPPVRGAVTHRPAPQPRNLLITRSQLGRCPREWRAGPRRGERSASVSRSAARPPRQPLRPQQVGRTRGSGRGSGRREGRAGPWLGRNAPAPG